MPGSGSGLRISTFTIRCIWMNNKYSLIQFACRGDKATDGTRCDRLGGGSRNIFYDIPVS